MASSEEQVFDQRRGPEDENDDNGRHCPRPVRLPIAGWIGRCWHAKPLEVGADV